MAQAWVRTVNHSGHPLRWLSPCLTLVVEPIVPESRLRGVSLRDAVLGASEAWSRNQIACSAIEIQVIQASGEQSSVSQEDGTNRIFVRRPRLCSDGEEGRPCTADAEIALTTTRSSSLDGTIFGADIEINGVDFVFGDVSAAPDPWVFDLQSVLTHELGHLIGFGHACRAPREPQAIDDAGFVTGECSFVDPETLESTMVATTQPGTFDLRSLSEDDRRGVCAVYPASPGESCDWRSVDVRAGCTVAKGPARAPGLLTVLVVCLVAVRRKVGPRRAPARLPGIRSHRDPA